MKTATFKQWTLTELDNAFGLKQIWDSSSMQEWENTEAEMSACERDALLKLKNH